MFRMLWRYSHLTLAISSSFFLLIASITGVVLSLEPIDAYTKPYRIDGLQEISVAEVLKNVKGNYEAVFEIEIDENDFVVLSGLHKNGRQEKVYINPRTGEVLDKVSKRAPLFEFTTSLHRSLFLKSTGRIVVGLTSFLLFLLVVSGLGLLIKRQGGWRRFFFFKTIKDNSHEYYHVVFGKWTLVPMAIIAFSGAYLSLEKFDVISRETAGEIHISQDIEETSSPLFNRVFLHQLKHLEFPFSPDEDDYYIVSMHEKVMHVQQYNQTVLKTFKNTPQAKVSEWMLDIHTARGNVIWSCVLMLSSMAVLLFMYTGTRIALNRLRHSQKLVNTSDATTANAVVLVGSETGSTFVFANQLKAALELEGHSVFVDAMNAYQAYPKLEYLFVLTATYGDGEAPHNATKFRELYTRNPIRQKIHYAIIGFGSLAYPKYCQFAMDVDQLFSNHRTMDAVLPLFKINNKSFLMFKLWSLKWNGLTKMKLELMATKHQLPVFKVLERTNLNQDNTFLLLLQPLQKHNFQSGDLLGILPEKDGAERLYSVAKIDGNILLSIKKHEKGTCSTYLSNLEVGDLLEGRLCDNEKFHFPKGVKEIILIANGTGIAPFLGMLDENTEKYSVDLYLGLRDKASFEIYYDTIEKALQNKHLTSVDLAFSRSDQQHVQDRVLLDIDKIVRVLQNEGRIFVCGSLQMKKSLAEKLNSVLLKKFNATFEELERQEKIVTDCY